MNVLRIYWRRALTRLEIALYAALIGIVLTVFLERLLTYMELAERTAMEITVLRVNSALQVYAALSLVDQSAPARSRPADRNPLRLARVSVPNVLPELEDETGLAELERGNWVFDNSRKELIYLPRLYRHLSTEDPAHAIRFRLVASHGGRSLTLALAGPYAWLDAIAASGR